MKKMLKKLLFVTVLTMLCVVMAVTADAATYSGTCGAQGDNLTWSIDTDTATLHIDGEGDMADYNYEGYLPNVKAPWDHYAPYVNYITFGSGVESIGEYAFYACENSIVVNIPETIKTIKSFAFNRRSTVVVDENNPYFVIDDYGVVFSPDGTVMKSIIKKGDYYAHGSYHVPEGVIEITVDALRDFEKYSYYYTITLSSTVEILPYRKEILYPKIAVDENNPYYSADCGVLYNKDKSVIISAPHISAQEDYVIPETVTEIADYAFYGSFDGHFGFLIPENVKFIGDYAFGGSCPGTKIISVSRGVEELGYNCFENVYTLYFDGAKDEWEEIDGSSFCGVENIEYEHVHVWRNVVTNDVCVSYDECSVCGCAETIYIEHNLIDSGCTIYFDCVNGGEAEYICRNDCGFSKRVTVPPRGEHSWFTYDIGSGDFDCETGGTRDYECRYCEATKTETVPPRGEHSWYKETWFECGEYNCEEGGLADYACHYCEATKTEVIEPKPHRWLYPTEKELSQFCDEFRFWVTCGDCCCDGFDEVFQGTAEHKYYKKWTELTKATCSFPGISVRSCKNCPDIESRTEPAYGHFDDDEDGKCDECKVVIEIYAPNDPSIPVEPGIPDYPGQPDESHTEHTFGDWLEKGDFQYRVCSYCGYVESRIAVEGGEVEFEYPSQPDCEFEADAITGGEFLLIEINAQQTLGQNIAVLKAFDLTMKNSEGVHVQPDGSVKVKLPLDWDKKGNYKVYRVNADGTYTDMDAFRQGSHMVFETDHFSIYIITEEVDTPEAPNDSPDDSCSCNCHKSGIMGFIWKIINFFQKLFRIKPTCACGVAHY